MPPDANKERRREAALIDSNDSNGGAATTTSSSGRIIASVNDIKPNEIAIDGVIYSLDGFNHPGGDSIKLFGGNDVTVQYKMIHPWHENNRVSKKLQRVGKIADYACDYKFGTPFEKEIKKEVFKIVQRGKEFGTWGWHIRAAFYTSVLFILQYCWAFHGSTFWLAVAYGVSQALIGLNVQHDANHGAASKNHMINEIYGLGADLIGGSKWLWMEQHWTHHAYTNDLARDPDTGGAEPLVLFHPYPLNHAARSIMHRFQVLYTTPVLSLYWLSSLFNPAHFDLKHRGAQEKGIRMESDFIKSRLKYALMLRMYYVSISYISPFFHHDWVTALAHIAIMGSVGSVFLGVLFSVSHNFENVERDPLGRKASARNGDDDGSSSPPVCWFQAQVETSSTYGGWLAGWITGGLNFQIEHHLFPRMSSAWYPTIAPVIREICKKHGVHYEYYGTLWENLISTAKYTHAVGTGNSALVTQEEEQQHEHQD